MWKIEGEDENDDEESYFQWDSKRERVILFFCP
jgi:hypothetical protein